MGYDTTLSLDRELPDLFSGNRTKIVNETEALPAVGKAEAKLSSGQDETAADAEKSEQSAEMVDNDRIRESLESLNQFIPLVNTNLVFEFDDLNEPPIIKVIDKESKELIREIPSRDLDKVAKAFGDMVDTLNKSGALFNTEI
ncbi:flagellar protein FlaG [Rheinheimera sp. 4Y26]|uniref:flagellar protein FlaG n=1 Tax=Rheinheimera sp. 4Y26 TaxID=2977811 RepID=UPI0021B109F8|nr:flagellar protein FlaG [Rheinheimera sp. 4Y26]MCT6700561.1 flagellar protein FlaG [Rheinheimera sp. 4Y26]